MKEKCFDEATIQSFLDGELAPVLSENVACHIAECETCLMLVDAVEQENTFVFNAMANEFNVTVPTEKIWASINAEIKETKISWWQKILRFNILPEPSMIMAGIFLLFALGFGLYLNLKPQTNEGLAIAQPTKKVEPKQVPEVISTEPIVKPVQDLPQINIATSKPRQSFEKPNFVIEKAVYRPEIVEKKLEIKAQKPKTKNQIPKTEAPQFIKGEETYLKTITTLSKTVDSNKDEMMRPSARINYEKNLAIVDDAISKMRKQVRKNPKDETAKEILFASYQNKINLLNSISEKNELIATIR